jgi:tryptophanase
MPGEQSTEEDMESRMSAPAVQSGFPRDTDNKDSANDEPEFTEALVARTLAEPYRVKTIERITLPRRAEREEILRHAFYSPVYLNSQDVFIDLITDSGTGAMSDLQWAGLMRGDEAYMGSRSFFAFEKAVQDAVGFKRVIPTHQGRAAENIVMELMVKPGDIVLSNTHFDTTRAHVQHRKATPVDLMSDDLWRFSEPRPFKGNFDLAKLDAALQRHGARVPMIIITVLNNLACSSPVSLENIREVSRLAEKHRVPVFFDACRFAENAYFIKKHEAGYGHKSIAEIAREMFSYGRGCWMSAKKDAIVNIGGFIATDDSEFAGRCQERLVLYEGFSTYGGLAGRDLEAIAVGMHEGMSEDHLAHRTAQVRYLGELLERAGFVVSRPIGGSGVFVDVEALYPHLPPEKLPGVALCADFYLEGGVRLAAAPFSLHTVSAQSGEIFDRTFHIARFAVPRRVYSKAHMEYVAGVAERVAHNAPKNPGYRMVHTTEVLGHFFTKFEPITSLT